MKTVKRMRESVSISLLAASSYLLLSSGRYVGRIIESIFEINPDLDNTHYNAYFIFDIFEWKSILLIILIGYMAFDFLHHSISRSGHAKLAMLCFVIFVFRIVFRPNQNIEASYGDIFELIWIIVSYTLVLLAYGYFRVSNQFTSSSTKTFCFAAAFLIIMHFTASVFHKNMGQYLRIIAPEALQGTYTSLIDGQSRNKLPLHKMSMVGENLGFSMSSTGASYAVTMHRTANCRFPDYIEKLPFGNPVLLLGSVKEMSLNIEGMAELVSDGSALHLSQSWENISFLDRRKYGDQLRNGLHVKSVGDVKMPVNLPLSIHVAPLSSPPATVNRSRSGGVLGLEIDGQYLDVIAPPPVYISPTKLNEPEQLPEFDLLGGTCTTSFDTDIAPQRPGVYITIYPVHENVDNTNDEVNLDFSGGVAMVTHEPFPAGTLNPYQSDKGSSFDFVMEDGHVYLDGVAIDVHRSKIHAVGHFNLEWTDEVLALMGSTTALSVDGKVYRASRWDRLPDAMKGAVLAFYGLIFAAAARFIYTNRDTLVSAFRRSYTT